MPKNEPLIDGFSNDHFEPRVERLSLSELQDDVRGYSNFAAFCVGAGVVITLVSGVTEAVAHHQGKNDVLAAVATVGLLEAFAIAGVAIADDAQTEITRRNNNPLRPETIPTL